MVLSKLIFRFSIFEINKDSLDSKFLIYTQDSIIIIIPGERRTPMTSEHGIGPSYTLRLPVPPQEIDIVSPVLWVTS